MMEQEPFFSIIIPTYNRGKFIVNTLNSVFEQDYQSFEVIVVDNCSTDNTIEQINSYPYRNKIKLHINDKNYERARSRNEGMRLARGQFLTFLDSDDLMYANNLSDAWNYINQNPESKFFHNFYELVDTKGNPIHSYHFKPLNNALKRISEGNFLSCIGVFLHIDLFKRIEWDENAILTGSEDYDFWLRVTAEFPEIGRIPHVNSGIIHHGERTINNQQIEDCERRFKYMLEKYEKDKTFKEIYGAFFVNIASTLWIFLAGLLLENNQPTKSVLLLIKVFKEDKKACLRDNYIKLFIRSLLGILLWRNKKF